MVVEQDKVEDLFIYKMAEFISPLIAELNEIGRAINNLPSSKVINVTEIISGNNNTDSNRGSNRTYESDEYRNQSSVY